MNFGPWQNVNRPSKLVKLIIRFHRHCSNLLHLHVKIFIDMCGNIVQFIVDRRLLIVDMSHVLPLTHVTTFVALRID